MYQSKKSGNSNEIKPEKEKENNSEINFSPFVIGVKPKNTQKSVLPREDIPPQNSIPSQGFVSRKPYNESKKVRKKRFASRTQPERSISIVTEYAATRRVNIILFSVISLIGVFIGIMYAKDLDADKLAVLRESGNVYFSDISMSAMTVKILTSVLYSAVYIVVVFLGGFTIFAPVVSAAANLIKSVLFGFMTAALIFTAGGKFDAGIAALYVLFGTAQILILALASGEALGFSVFLLKNEESYKKSLSFPNVSLYSIRHVIFLILLSSMSVLETIIIPLMYDLMY